jgi:hypothetical protein
MFFSLVKWVLISLTLIFLIHHIYMFLMNTLTVPKIKDLVNKPNEQYKDILATLGGGAPPTSWGETPHNPPLGQASPASHVTTSHASAHSTSGGVGGVPPDIGNELSSFLNELKKTSSSKKNVNDFASLPNESGYSLY